MPSKQADFFMGERAIGYSFMAIPLRPAEVGCS
jgi:hypothetical protein